MRPWNKAKAAGGMTCAATIASIGTRSGKDCRMRAPAYAATSAHKTGMDRSRPALLATAGARGGRQRQLALPPRWRRRFRAGTVDGVCGELLQGDFNRALELRVMACDHVFGPVLDIDVRSLAFVLDVPLALAVEEAAAWSDRRAAIDERRSICGMDEPAPGALTNERADLAVVEHPGHEVAAGAGHFVDDHHLRPPDARGGAGERIAVARDVVEVTVEIALQDVDDVVGRGAAAVESLVDDGAELILLREVVAVEAGVARLAGVGQVHVRQFAAGELVDEPAVGLDEGAGAEALLIGHRDDRNLVRAFESGTVTDGKNGLLIGRAVQQAVDVIRRAEFLAVDREDVIAHGDVDARGGEWRSQVGIPGFGIVDAGDLIAAVLDREIRAEQSAGVLRDGGHIAAAHVGVADGDLGAHHIHQIVEVGAVVHVRQELAVHLLHARPVGAVHVGDIQVVALVAPVFVEDLLELFAGFEVHAELRIERSLAGLGRLAVGIDEEDLRAAPAGGCRAAAASASASACAGAAVNELVAIGADLILRDAAGERCGPAVAQAVAHERRAGAGTGRAASAIGAASTRFEIVDRSGNTRAESGVLALGNIGHGEDALLEAVEVDRDGDGSTGSRALGLRLIGGCGCGGCAASAAAGAGGAGGADALVLIAFRQQRAGVAFLEHGDVDAEVLVVVVGGHIEPLGLQAEIRGGEEPEIFSAGVPRGPDGVGQAIGDLLGFAGLGVGDEDGVVEGLQATGVGDPLGVRAPDRVDGAAGHHPRIAANDSGLAARDVEHPDVEVGIGIDEPLGIGRPGGRVVVAVAGEGDRARRRETVLRFDDKLILAGAVAEIGDVLAVRGPGGIALGGAGRMGEIADIALFGGYGEDLAAGLDEHALAGGGDAEIGHAGGDILPARHHPGEVAGGGDGYDVLLAGFGIELVNVAGLLEDHGVGAGVEGFHVEIGEVGELGELLRFGVVGPDIGDAIAIGDEVDGVADPGGVHVLGVGPWRGGQVEGLEVDDPDGAVLAAAVVAALLIPGVVHAVGDARAIGRDLALIAARNRERLFHAARGGNGPEAGCGAGGPGGAGGGEEDGLAVRSPALGRIGAGMPGEALGLAAVDGYRVDVGVAAVIGAERDGGAVRGKVGIARLTLEAGEAAGDAAGALDHPDVIGVGECDVGGADGRGAEQAGGRRVGAVDAGLPGGEEQSQAKWSGEEGELLHKVDLGVCFEPVYNAGRARCVIPTRCCQC